MREPCDGTPLTCEEPAQALATALAVIAKDLDRCSAARAYVLREPDFAHRPAPDAAYELVVTNDRWRDSQ